MVMKRNIAQLSQTVFDVLVIGGGIYGVCTAWDAALRGLSVALVEQADFGHATSANSLKIIHGGLRYLQDGDLGLVRAMSQERRIWLQIAPHLVHPLPCLMPTDNSLLRQRAVLATALAVNDWLSYDRNRGLDSQKHLPNGRTISKADCLARLPGLEPDGVNGGALWYDAQMYNSERLLLSFVLGAVAAGAVAANHVEVVGFLREKRSVRGVIAKDVLTGQTIEVRARLTINCAGAWIDPLLSLLGPATSPTRFVRSIAMNLVTRQFLSGCAVALPSKYRVDDGTGRLRERTRTLFMVPWREYSLIGTIHAPAIGPQSSPFPTEAEVVAFIEEINRAYPPAGLNRADVYQVHYGYLPMVAARPQPAGVKLLRQSRLVDHAQDDGLAGLLTVVGVKYTTARRTAQHVVDLAVKKLGRPGLAGRSHTTPLYGGQIGRFAEFMAQAIAQRPPGLEVEVMRRLVYNYGTTYQKILDYRLEAPGWGRPVANQVGVLQAEVIHAVRQEMAQTLGDVIQRRTELGAAGLPADDVLQACADLMAGELGWDQGRIAAELARVRAAYPLDARPVPERVGIR
jgi:glycerol-3-phosphate dehydrogenase